MGWYRIGTVSINNGSRAVTGSGTQWVSVAKVKAGDAIRMPDFRDYEVGAVNSDLSITLAEDYLGTNVSGGSYAIKPTISPMRDLVDPVTTLVNDFTTVKNNAAAGRFVSGTTSAPGIKSTTDTDTGLSWPVDNVLAMSAAAEEVARASASGFTLSKNLGVKNATPGADVHIGSGSAATLGSTAPLIWVSARALSSGANVSPQDLLRLSWQEGSQDLGSGEGVAISFAASLVGDAGTFYSVARIASRKVNTADTTDARASSLVFSVSQDGAAAPIEAGRFDPDGSLVLAKGVKFGSGTVGINSVDRGQFTPVISDAPTGGNLGSAAIAQGRYVKIGNFVLATVLLVDIDTTGLTPSNVLTIQGMPYPARSEPNTQYTIGTARLGRITFSDYTTALLADATDYLRIGQSISGSSAAFLLVSALESGAADISITITYETDE